MTKLNNIEFYTSPEGGILIKKQGEVIREMSESDTDLINNLFERIRNDYPEAFKSLNTCYQKSERNFTYFRFLCVRRFIKCNFSNYDTLSDDIDSTGQFHFEQVQCPMRGECLGYNVICNAKYNTKLSTREMQILELYCKPMEMSEIANELFISPATVDVHVRKIREKLDIHDKAGLVKFYENKMR